VIRRRKNILALILAVAFSSTLSYKVSAAFPTTKRLAGADRYITSLKVAQDGWNSSYYAILACGEDYPDALSSVPLAKKYDAPILLTHRTYIDSSVLEELKSLNVGKVFVIGGTGSVNDRILSQLNSLGMQTERIGGADRYETSVKIAEKFGKVDTLTVATGQDYADAISIGSVAAAMGVPVILVPKNIMPDSVKNYVKNLDRLKTDDGSSTTTTTSTFKGYKVFVVGDSSIISDNVTREFENIGNDTSSISGENPVKVERITGDNKYTRNINIMARFLEKSEGESVDPDRYSNGDDDDETTQYSTENDLLSLKNLYIASGEGFADALSGAALAAKTKSPVVLSGPSNGDVIKNFILSKSPNYNADSTFPEYLTVLGGEAVMPSVAVNQIFGNVAFDNTVDFNGSSDNSVDVNDSTPVKFRDNQFERLIRNKVGIQDREIHYSDLRNITSLDLSNQGITDISGIQNCTNLKRLDLSYNSIEKLSPIISLTQLEELNLSHNQIEDISYISNLSSLKNLNLSDNLIDDLKHSRKLYKDDDDDDEYEEVSENVFKNLTHLVSLDLSNADEKSNRYPYYYNKDRNKISSIENLKDLVNLTYLNLQSTSVSNLDYLEKMTKLDTLNISHSNVSSLDDLKKVKSITHLDISYNLLNTSDVKALKELTKLKYLDASNNDIDDVSVLRGLGSLTTLYLEDNPIKDYTPILDSSKSLYYKDFYILNPTGDEVYSSNEDLNAMIKNQISTFAQSYSYDNYDKLKYRQLYKSYDSGSYDDELAKLNADRELTNIRISKGNFTDKELMQMRKSLDNISNQIADIKRKEEMNYTVKNLEANLSGVIKPIEREKIINKINYGYSDYRYDYYRTELSRCNEDIDILKAQGQLIASESPSYEGSNNLEYIQYQLDKRQRDRDFAQEKINTYDNYRNFFNAITAVLDEN
jgi:Putative cell wall-binding domain